jgi:hypothetical protein
MATEPKPIVLMPSGRHLPYGPSGTLLPEGPEYPITPPATDIVGLPWKRYLGSEWTTLEQRSAVMDFLRAIFKEAFPNYRVWEIIERDYAPRSATRLEAPLLILSVTTAKGRKLETAMAFQKAARGDLAEFKAVLAHARLALQASYAEL